MERVIPPLLKNALKRNRDTLNSIYEYHRSAVRVPDSEELFGFFLKLLLPLFEKGFEPAGEIVTGIFRESLILTSKGYAGKSGRYSDIEESIFTILGSCPELLAAEKNFTTHLFNALFNLRGKGTAALKAWSGKMSNLEHKGSIEHFKNSGLLLAWRYGAARFRETALAIIETFSDDDIRYIFDIPENSDTGKFIDQLKHDPWGGTSDRDKDKPVFLNSGGFSGYGGVFRNIPEVFSSDGLLFAMDGSSIFRIYADSFGVELLHEREEPAGEWKQGKGLVYGQSREIIISGKSFKLPENISGNVKSSASIEGTAAWTEVNSYRVYIAGVNLIND